MADNIFNIPGFNGLPYNPQMPMLAKTSQTPNVQGSQFINPYEKQNQGMSPYTMQPSWQFGLNYNQMVFSSAVQGIGAFLRGNNQKKDFASYNKAQQNPLSQIPENPNNTDQALYGMKQYAEGGKFDDFDDFDEDDFEDLKGELDRYFNEDKTAKPTDEPKEEDEAPEQEKQPEQEEQEEQPLHGAMDFLNQPQQEDDTQINQSDAEIMGQLSGEKPIPKPEQPHPSVYAGKPDDKVEAFKRGIAQVESAGYQEGNKNSTAFGKYQFTAPTREGVREQFFKDIPKADFETAYKSDPKFQERVMDVYGSHLLQKYSDPHQAATAFFLGEGKANMYNQPDYNPGHGNVSVGKYLNTFDKGYNRKQGGHIMNSPGSVTTGFDKPYNFKMEDGGDPNQPPQKKPSTADSLALYNNAKQVRDYYLKNPDYQTLTPPVNRPGSELFKRNDAGLQLMKNNNYFTMQPGGVNSTKITPDQYRKNIDNNRYYQRENQNAMLDINSPMSLFDKRVSPQYEASYYNNKTGDVVNLNQYDPIAVKPWNMLTPDERQQRISKYGDPTKGQQPSQPPVAKRSQIQGPQQIPTGTPNIGTPTGGPGPLAGGPTNFSFTGRNDQGQQDTRYFSDLDTWKAATDQMGYRWREETNNGKQANASGYQFKEGGEYNLTNAQIKQLKAQGYQIDII